MRRNWLAKGLALGLVALGAPMVGACAEAEGMFYVSTLLGRDDPTTPFDPEGCIGDGIQTGVYKMTFIRNSAQTVTLFNSLESAFCVHNKLHSNKASGVETSNILISEFEFSLSEGNSTVTGLSAAIAADTVEGSRQLEGGLLAAALPLFTLEQAAPLLPPGTNSASFSGSIIFRGRTTGGIDIETPEFLFPIVLEGIDCICLDPDDESPLNCRNLPGSTCM